VRRPKEEGGQVENREIGKVGGEEIFSRKWKAIGESADE
jgi:hypothetical protein